MAGRSCGRKLRAVQVRGQEAEIVVVGSEADHRGFALASEHRIAIEGAGLGGAASEGVHGGVVSVRPDRILGIIRKRVAEAVRVTVVSSGRVRGGRYRDAQREVGCVIEVSYQPTMS